MTNWWRTAGAAVACLTPAAVVAASPSAVWMAVLAALAGGLFAVAWPRLAGVAEPIAATVLLALAVAADVTASLAAPDGGRWALAVVAALGVSAAFIREIVRRSGRAGLVDSVAATVTGVAAVTGLALWIQVSRADDAVPIALAVGAAAAVVTLATRLWRRAAGPLGWADGARLVWPLAVAGPVAWLVTLAIG
jgi:hypothetical protein